MGKITGKLMKFKKLEKESNSVAQDEQNCFHMLTCPEAGGLNINQIHLIRLSVSLFYYKQIQYKISTYFKATFSFFHLLRKRS